MGYALFFGMLAGAMAAFPEEAAQASREALTLWATAVAPVLGPFMACMLLIVSRLPGGRAFRDTGLALLMIGVCMMLGGVSARLIACAFPFLPPGASAAAQCLMEVASGVKALIGLKPPAAAPLVCAACSFGGLSLLMQNAAFWRESGVTVGQLFILRVLHGLLSGILCLAGQALFSFGL